MSREVRHELRQEDDFVMGHYCPSCGTYHKWSSYVYAHFKWVLKHTCECGQVVLMENGEAWVED